MDERENVSKIDTRTERQREANRGQQRSNTDRGKIRDKTTDRIDIKEEQERKIEERRYKKERRKEKGKKERIKRYWVKKRRERYK